MNRKLYAVGCWLFCVLVAGCTPRGESTEAGKASFYGSDFAFKKTASGETYVPIFFTAAHPTLPFDTWVRVERMDTGDDVVVRINDRGPYAHGRIIDLSRRAAAKIDMIEDGVAPVEIFVIEEAPEG